jgi:hypothetical protein
LPFYIAAIYGLIKGRQWVKDWGLVWSTAMFYSVSVIMLEGLFGEYATPQPIPYILGEIMRASASISFLLYFSDCLQSIRHISWFRWRSSFA